MTCTSASARTISARPATSSGRDVNAALMADQEGGGCANASDASGGTGPSASSARLVLSMASAPRTSLTSARASASSRATSTSARSTSDCGAVPLAYRAFAALTTSRANASCSETSAVGPPALLHHQERVGRLHADVQGGPARLSAQPIDIGQGGCAAVPANAGQRDLLLDREADVRAAQHEGQVIERGRDHRVVERGHDGGSCLAGANACARRLDLVSPLAGEANDVAEAQGRRKHLASSVPPLGSARSRPTP